MDYIPNTSEQKKEMLKDIGLKNMNELFADVPEEIHLKGLLDIPKRMSEQEIKKLMTKLAGKNINLVSFQGAGAYNHFIPSVVNHMISRSEFYTAYTPYQPEISQGILQAIFEYQTMICELTGMDVANASMYDGASALAESVILSKAKTRKNEVLISKAVHPEYRKTVMTYAHANSIKITEIDIKDGKTDVNALKEAFNDDVACVLVQSPNYLGQIEDLETFGNLTKENSSVFVVTVTDPTSLGLMKSPGELGADIVVGEGQSFGNPVNFGGPYLGIIAVKKDFMRLIPGRLVGETVDMEGKKGYLLTLQAREQHIRREKATSNICSNEALCALAASVYLSMAGKQGLNEVAMQNYHKSHYAYNAFKKAGMTVFDNEFYNEFVVEVKDLDKKFDTALEKGIVPGVKLEDDYPEMKDMLLVCATETNTKDEMDLLLEVLK